MVTIIDIRKVQGGVERGLDALINIVDPRRIDDFYENLQPQKPEYLSILIWALLSLFFMLIVDLVIPYPLNAYLIIVLLFLTLLFSMYIGNYVTNFLLFAGSFTFIGYFLSSAWSHDLLNSTKIGFLWFFIAVIFITGESLALPLIGNRTTKLAKEKDSMIEYLQAVIKGEGPIDFKESFSLTTHAGIPGLMGGIFAASSLTFVLSLLAVLYSVYLLYVGIVHRIGFNNAIAFMIVAIFTSGAITMLAAWVVALVLGIPAWGW